MASNNLSITMFNKICRICLKEGQLLMSLYDENNVLNLVENLETCTLVQFTKNDGLPEKICSTCIIELRQSYNFAMKCKTNDTILRKCFISYHNSVLQEINDNVPELTLNNVDIKTENVIVPLNHCENIFGESNEIELKQLNFESTLVATSSTKNSLRNRNKKVDYNETTIDNKDILSKKQLNSKKTNKKTRKKMRIFKCKTCLKTFHNSGNLNAHHRIHTGEKPYKCDTCSKTFNLSNNLTKHKRIHSGERPYKCDICSETFKYSKDLKIHLKCHTN